MRIVYNNILPIKGFVAINLFGIIFARREFKPIGEATLTHEAIHSAQAKDCHGWLWFYLLYLGWWLIRGYADNPFEKEAYAHQHETWYLEVRNKNAWKKYR